MKQLRLFLLLAAGLFLTSCSEPQPDEFPNPDPPPTVGRHAVPIDQALGELHDLLGVIDGQGTRAGGVRTVAQVQTLHAQALPLTRSASEPGEQPENLLYVVNFEDDAGYAVLGADDRLPAVLAVTDEGSLTTEELIRAANGQTAPEEFTFPNEMLMNYVSGIGGIGGGIGGGGIGGGGGIPTGPFTDFDKQLGNPDPFFSHYEETDWETLSKVPSMLYTTWNQDNPYNCFCPATGELEFDSDQCPTEKRCLAGCVPIACAQITAYHSKVNAPNRIGDRVIDWISIRKAMLLPNIPKIEHNNIPQTTAAVGVLIRSIGDAVVTKYGAQRSGASTKDAETFFRWLGYRDVYRRGYDIEGIRVSLMNKRMPVFISGYSTEAGHAWVLDGILQQHRDKLAVRTTGEKTVVNRELRYFLHCNYGWGGSKDGYYFDGIFDTNHKPTINKNSKGPGDYSGKLEIITYTSPVQ